MTHGPFNLVSLEVAKCFSQVIQNRSPLHQQDVTHNGQNNFEVSTQGLPYSRGRNQLPEHPQHVEPPLQYPLLSFNYTWGRQPQEHRARHARHAIHENLTYDLQCACVPKRNSSST